MGQPILFLLIIVSKMVLQLLAFSFKIGHSVFFHRKTCMNNKKKTFRYFSETFLNNNSRSYCLRFWLLQTGKEKNTTKILSAPDSGSRKEKPPSSRLGRTFTIREGVANKKIKKPSEESTKRAGGCVVVGGLRTGCRAALRHVRGQKENKKLARARQLAPRDDRPASSNGPFENTLPNGRGLLFRTLFYSPVHIWSRGILGAPDSSR